MKLGLDRMINQFRRIWTDNGSNDKDFTEYEKKLRTALETLRDSAHNMKRAAELFLDVINERR